MNLDPNNIKASGDLTPQKLFEMLNFLQENIFSLNERMETDLDTLGSDVARLVINLVALTNLLIDTGVLKKEQVQEYIKKAATDFQQSLQQRTEQEELPEDIKI